MRCLPLFLTALVVTGAAAAAVFGGGASPGYREGPAAVAKGGGASASGKFSLVATVDDAGAGSAASTGFRLTSGYLPALGVQDGWFFASAHADPQVLGWAGDVDLRWAAGRDGSFEVLVDGSVHSSGVFTKSDVVTSSVASTDLPANDYVEVVVRATADGRTRGVSYRLYNDTLPPDLRGVSLAKLVAQVDTAKALAGTDQVRIVVPGGIDVNHPLFPAGGFQYEFADPVREVSCEVTNRVGRTVRRTLELIGGALIDPDPGEVEGRTVLWPAPDGESEIDFTITSKDVKGKLAGIGVLRLAGDPAEYDLPTLSGKLSNKAKKKGRKFKLKLKSARGVKPKAIVSVSGWYTDVNVVTLAKVKVSVKKLYKRKHVSVNFNLRVDAGNPIRIGDLTVDGEVEDARPGSRVTVEFLGKKVFGTGPVAFTGTLTAADRHSATMTAEDDAVPANRGEFPVFVLVDHGW